MAGLLTRAEMRDAIRRDLQIVPPVDSGITGAVPGQQPGNDPSPSNPQINQALDQAISDINRFSGYNIRFLTHQVDASSSSFIGPLEISLNTLGLTTPFGGGSGDPDPPGTVIDIRRVLWTDLTASPSLPILLRPSNRNALDRGDVSTYYNTGVGIPQSWYVLGYSLFITPAPADAGIFTVTCGAGVIGFISDTSYIDGIPSDFQWIVEYQSIVRLSKSNTLDVEAQERAAMFGQDAQRGMLEFKAWVEGNSGVVQPSLSYGGNYRSGYGRRRTVR